MTLQFHKVGLFDVGTHLVSGIPFLTGSTLLSSSFATDNAQQEVEFPFVARTITVINTSDAPIRAHFNRLSDGNVETGRHFVTIPSASNSFTFNVVAKEIFVSLANNSADGAFELVAELMPMDKKNMLILTGSGLTE